MKENLEQIVNPVNPNKKSRMGVTPTVMKLAVTALFFPMALGLVSCGTENDGSSGSSSGDGNPISNPNPIVDPTGDEETDFQVINPAHIIIDQDGGAINFQDFYNNNSPDLSKQNDILETSHPLSSNALYVKETNQMVATAYPTGDGTTNSYSIGNIDMSKLNVGENPLEEILVDENGETKRLSQSIITVLETDRYKCENDRKNWVIREYLQNGEEKEPWRSCEDN